MEQDQVKKNKNRKEKNRKNNVETSLLMTQNTNVFSQLSANYLQTKQNVSEQQTKFIKNTQIIEYHDPSINRILGSLRKKAQATKVKAIIQLKEYVSQMKEQDIENFISTFAYLFREILLNQQSKQLIDQINSILLSLIDKYKKIVVSQISVLFPPMLLSQKLSTARFLPKLFNGDQQSIKLKALILLLKQDVTKQFIILTKLILDNQDQSKLNQPNFQRNCPSIIKAFKQYIYIFTSLSTQNKEKLRNSWENFYREFGSLFHTKGVQFYLTNGGRPKAAFLEIFIQYLDNEIQTTISSQWLIKRIQNSFLDKDINIQSTLWKFCNTRFLKYLHKINKISLFTNADKLFDVLKIGGPQMYKQLPNFLAVFPDTILVDKDINQINPALIYIRKFNQYLLSLEEENQARLQSYLNINKYFISQYHHLRQTLTLKNLNEKQSKRRDECKKLLDKIEREAVQKLEQFYYQSPPVSRNSFSNGIPSAFKSLLEIVVILPAMKFKRPYTYHLYKQVAQQERFKPIIDEIFSTRQTLEQKIQYFEYFPARPINVVLQGGDVNQIYQKCRLFLLTIQYQKLEFKWNFYYNLFLFDPLLEVSHLQKIEANEPIYFNKKLYQYPVAKFDDIKLQFFYTMLKNREPKLRYFIPSFIEILKRQEKVNWEPLITTFTAEIASLDVPNILIIKNVENLYRIIIGYFNSIKDNIDHHLDLFFSKYFWFILYAYERNMIPLSLDLLQNAKVFRESKLFDMLLASLRTVIIERIQVLVESGVNIEEKKQKGLKKKILVFLQFFNKVSQFLVQHRSRDQLIMIASELLHIKFFRYAIFRLQIWQITYNVFGQLEQEELNQLINKSFQKNIQSIVIILCVNYLFPLQSNLQLKKYFVQLNSTFVKSKLLNSFELGQSGSFAIINCMIEKSFKQSLIYSIGLKNCLKTLIVQHQDESLIDKFFTITIQRIISLLQSATNTTSLMRYSIILKNLLPEFGDLLNKHQQLLKIAYQKVLQLLPNQFQIDSNQRILLFTYIDVLSIYWNRDIGLDLLFENESKILNSIITKVFNCLAQGCSNIYFEMQTFFNMLNTVIQKKTLEPFSDYLLLIQKYVSQLIAANRNNTNIDSKFSGDSMIKLCQFLRKILSVSEAFSPDFKLTITNQILGLCRIKVEQYQLISEDIDAGVIDQNIDSVIIQFSELISRFALAIQPKINQDLLISLLACNFVQIQKSAFLVLRQMYLEGIGSKGIPQIYFDILKKQCEDSIVSKFSHTLVFICLFLRKSSDAYDEDQTLQQLLESRKIPQLYLDFIFETIEWLGYDDTQKEFYLQPKEISNLEGQWSNYLNNSQLFKLQMQSLFIFASLFPMWLRIWVDAQKSKRRRTICQSILKNNISDALFSKEVQKIELRQKQWKSEHFEVFSLPKSKQISARYSKQNAVISLRLKIKNDYPLSSVIISYDHDLKIEAQLNKWALKLKSLLYNQNNSIVNGIVLWKQNIDKEFEGIQQCAICYDIVNGQKQLPRMSCKTCRKKFHGACIRKWFTTSNKSECPLCKSQFL